MGLPRKGKGAMDSLDIGCQSATRCVGKGEKRKDMGSIDDRRAEARRVGAKREVGLTLQMV